MYQLFLETAEKLGITLPVWFYQAVLSLTLLCTFFYLYRTYIRPLLATLVHLEMQLKKTDEIDKLKKIQDKAIQDSMKGDDSLKKEITIISGKVTHISKILMEMQDKIDASERARLKDKIRRIYADCHRNMQCTRMEKETLEELIRNYEEHKGTNSFVHTIVEPEIYLWTIADDAFTNS